MGAAIVGQDIHPPPPKVPDGGQLRKPPETVRQVRVGVVPREMEHFGLYPVQQENIVRGKLFVFFDGKCDGLRFEWLSHPECYTVERVADTMCRCRVDSMTHMYLELNDRMEQDKFIGNAEIEFIRQFDPAAADRYAKHREDFYARGAEQERTKALARQAEKDANRAKAQAELAAEKAKYLGWVDDMTPLRFGQVSALMDTSIRVDGKITTRREFIINCIKDGWVPQKKDGVTSWYKRGGEYKESNPRTEYELHKEGFVYVYKISKTEYDFAVYLVEHGAAS